MTSKTIMIGLVAIAFVAGSIMTGSMADAKKDDNPKVDPVAEAIDRLTAVMQGTATQGPQGDQGDQGLQGDKGDTVSLNTYVVDFTGLTNGNRVVECDSGDTALSGSYEKHIEDIINEVRIRGDLPDRVLFNVVDAAPQGTINISALCADTASPFRP